MLSSTGTTIEGYIDWIKKEVNNKKFGEVSITFVIHQGQITGVKKASSDNEVIPLEKKAR